MFWDIRCHKSGLKLAAARCFASVDVVVALAEPAPGTGIAPISFPTVGAVQSKEVTSLRK